MTCVYLHAKLAANDSEVFEAGDVGFLDLLLLAVCFDVSRHLSLSEESDVTWLTVSV